jgi:Uncharacterized protein conserved in bacteria
MKLPFGLNKNKVTTTYAPLAAGLAGLTIAGVTFVNVTDGATDQAAKAKAAPAAQAQAFALTAEEQAAARADVLAQSEQARQAEARRKAEAEKARVEAEAKARAKAEAEARAKAKAEAEAKKRAAQAERKLLVGTTRASYFWDDGSGRQGDTGMPASGKPMQKGLFASPSWPLGTEGYVIYKGRKAKFFIGDRGPGVPSSHGVMLDIDGKTFAELTGGTWNPNTLTVQGNGGLGHINVTYVITKWGDGPGRRGKPVPFATGAYRE